jgi:hypothetical protein
MSSSESVLDAMLAAAESMSETEASPSPPGVGFAPFVSGSPRRGDGMTTGCMTTEGAVTTTSFSLIDIDCSYHTYCFGVIKTEARFVSKEIVVTSPMSSSK